MAQELKPKTDENKSLELIASAISFAGEVFRKGVPAEKEAAAWASRHARMGKLLVDAINNQ